MNVILLNGAPRKRNTAAALDEFSTYLSKKNVVCTSINLHECKIQPCRGCINCFDKGEESCPHHNDIKHIISQMDLADGIVFFTPVYAFHISALLKNLFERISYIFHRPRFFGKVSTAVVTQGIYGGNISRKYLSFVGQALGFTVISGSVLQTRAPVAQKQKEKNSRALRQLSESYYKQLTHNRFPKPSLLSLTVFRIGRTKIKTELDDSYRDYTYYRDNGWFTSDFYYPVKISFVKKLYGNCIDYLTTFFFRLQS